MKNTARIIFVTGGARSGKSAYAAASAEKYEKVAFIATGQPLDEEMKARIKRHQQARPKDWTTFEEPENVAGLLTKIGGGFDCIVIDCLTLLVSNLILKRWQEKQVIDEISAILRVLKKKKARVIIVSNEVGSGVVPRNKLGRVFRDIAGRVNHLAADQADEVVLLVCGIAVKIKGA